VRFERLVRVEHGGRSRGDSGVAEVVLPIVPGEDAKSVGGQTRLAPALTERVGCPHVPQYGFRAFQSRSALPIAYIAAEEY
jgi:hypothetical protein